MTRLLLSLGLIGVLAGCGAEGDPVPPPPKEASNGPGITLSVTGKVEIGIAG